ncbi:MAG: YbaB/EbfC family nucleoid-associated protein [Candidatus Omnitrophota bacterium]|nr:YbaB/EbfC family nucleoid-associated protein [Candidatus Omnitrophota bacterium]MDZ4241470.1 YbaB/EbfC family nucleoid-associated protein [Candidatus Omnitrophota bacterium]
MLDKIKQLMEMKQQAEKIKKELEAVTVDVNEVRGIRIVISGAQDFRSVSVDEGLLDPQNKQRFEADLLRSLNAAVKKSQQAAAQKMASVMPGM